MAMLRCIDCGKPLSSTAITCRGCDSTDPFGIKRSRNKFQLIVLTPILVIVLGVLIALVTGLLTPDMVVYFLSHLLAQPCEIRIEPLADKGP